MKFNVVLYSILLLSGCSLLGINNDKDIDKEQYSNIPLSYDFQDVYMTKAYETAATRAANKMLDDTSELYETNQKPNIYIKQIQKTGDNLPDGFYTAQKSLREIIGKSGTFVLVNDMSKADYIIESTVSEFNAAGLPAILFRLNINTKDEQPYKAWNVVIRQLTEDKSWW